MTHRTPARCATAAASQAFPSSQPLQAAQASPAGEATATHPAQAASRRSLLQLGSAAAAGWALSAGAQAASAAPGPATAQATPPADKLAELPLALPALPYDAAALAPVITARTLGLHHGRHHKAYVDNTRKLVTGTPLQDASLDAIVRASAGQPAQRKLFENAAQAWNHAFFWQSLSPDGGGKPGAELSQRIDAAFGSLAGLRQAFLTAAGGQFGSGWVWLVRQRGNGTNTANGTLALATTPNADTPLTDPGLQPLLVLDVWEHAYYPDYDNRRLDYAAAVFDKLWNWRQAEAQLARG